MQFNPFHFANTSEQALVIIIIIWLTAMALFAAVFMFIVYKLKLFIPKSRLFDDTYVQEAVENTKRLTHISRIIFAVSGLACVVLIFLHITSVLNIFESPLFYAVFFVAFLSGLPIFGLRRRLYHKKSEAELLSEQIAYKRMRSNQKESPHQFRGKHALIFSVIILLVLAALVFFSLFRGMGKLGVIFYCLMLLIAIIALFAALPKFIRDVKAASGLKRIKEFGWLAFAAAMLTLSIYVFSGAVQDLPAKPVTAQVEVLSLTTKRLIVIHPNTGERVILRLGWLDRRLSLQELSEAWTAARSDAAYITANHQHAPVYCTITYYPHTNIRVSIENITTGQ